jgi:octaprenyl-diphosphate synthase
LTAAHLKPSIRNDSFARLVTRVDLSEIRAPVAEDMQAVDRLILRRLESDVVLINQIGQYIVGSGGKRLRPLAVLLFARACGYGGSRHTDLAAVVEFIHTATLLHDDVVDGSELRRSRETANSVWGNEASVLVGDFLYSRAFEMMVDVDNMRVMDILSHATNRIAEGEVLQLLHCNDPDTTEERYMEVIERKTATLFEAGTRLGAVLAHASEEVEAAAAQYGLRLGIAFQLVDDALDYRAEGKELGKNIGDDLAEGKPTLPIIRAMSAGTDQERELLRLAIETGGRERIDAVAAAIESTKSIDYTISLAHRYAESAKEAAGKLPESAQRAALEELADFAVWRTY